jgi:hypothetical protein
LVNVTEYEAPVESEAEENCSGATLSETMVWGALSWFVHVMTDPLFTVSGEGSKAKFLIATALPLPVAAGGDADPPGAVWYALQPAARQAATTKTILAAENTRRE